MAKAVGHVVVAASRYAAIICIDEPSTWPPGHAPSAVSFCPWPCCPVPALEGYFRANSRTASDIVSTPVRIVGSGTG